MTTTPRTTPTPRRAPASPLLTPEQTANLLGTTPAVLKTERAAGVGPIYHLLWPGTVRYNTASVIKWRDR